MAEWVRALACTGDRTVRAGFESHCGQLRFGTSLKVVGLFYLVSMPEEVKYPTSPHWNV